jgi:5-methylcytosine-specific restriction endonuclease McrA
MIYIKKNNLCVFYKPTPAIEQWQQDTGNAVVYLTECQRKYFDEFELLILVYQSPLTLDERRILFVRVQSGTPVRNTDLLKNTVDGAIISELNSIDWESNYRSRYMSRLTSSRAQNRLFCMVRLYRVFHAIKTDGDIRFVMESDDSQIKKMVQFRTLPALNLAAEFGKAMDTVYDAVDELEPKGKHYTPMQLFALAVEIFKAPDPESVNRLVSICQSQVTLVSETKTRNYDIKENKARKSLWFDALYKKDEYTKYYEDSRDFLRSDAVRSKPVPKARKISKNVTKTTVWGKQFGTNEVGSCYCCDKPLKFSDGSKQWQLGHIIAHANGGSDTDIDNFIVECKECNNAHKTMSADEYRRVILNK